MVESDSYTVQIFRASGSRNNPPHPDAEKRSRTVEHQDGEVEEDEYWAVDIPKDADITQWVDRFYESVIIHVSHRDGIDYDVWIYDDRIE